jgi:AcrR family transcriptional regulator
MPYARLGSVEGIHSLAKQPRSASAKLKRPPGRPVAAGAPDAREAIIKAARRLLETHIPAQVTNSMIAREAGADPALIRYYFGDRASLFMEVVQELMASVREARPPEPMNAEQFLRWRISATLRFSRTARSMQRIMVDELAESDSPKVRDAIRQNNQRLVDRYAELLKTELGDEVIDVDPLLLHVVIIGACEFFTSAQAVVRPLADPQVDSQTLAQQYEDFVCNLFLNGLRRR